MQKPDVYSALWVIELLWFVLFVSVTLIMIILYKIYIFSLVQCPHIIPNSITPTGILSPSPATLWSITYDQPVSIQHYIEPLIPISATKIH